MSVPTPSVIAAIRIMRLLRETGRPLGVSDIARTLDLNKSTAHGIISTMVSEHFLAEVEDSRRYQLGASLVELAEAVRGPMFEVARPFIVAFSQEAGLASFLATPYSNSEFLILYRSEGSAAGFRLTLSVGERFPLTAGALGKAFLAWQPAHTALEIIRRIGLPGRTRTSITQCGEFLKELRAVRSRGYGESREEYHAGIKGLAAPVFDSAGKVVLLLTAAALSQDLSPAKMKSRGTRLSAVADDVTRALGGTSLIR